MRKFFRVLFTTMVLASDAVSGMAIADERKVFGAMPKKTTKGRVASHVRSSLEELKTREGWSRRVEILRSVNRTVTDFTSQQGADLDSPELTFPKVYAMLLGVVAPKRGGETKEGSVDSIAGYTQVLLTYCSIFSLNPLAFFDKLYQKLNDTNSPVTRQVVLIQVISQKLYAAVKGKYFPEAERLLSDFSDQFSSLLLDSGRVSMHWNPGQMRDVLTMVGQSTHFSKEDVKKRLIAKYVGSMWAVYGSEISKGQSRDQLIVGDANRTIIAINNLIILNNLNIDYDLIVKVLNAWKDNEQGKSLSENEQLAAFYNEVIEALLVVMREDLSHHFIRVVERSHQARACMEVIKAVAVLPSDCKETEFFQNIKSLIVSFRNRGVHNNFLKMQAEKALLTEFIKYAYLHHQDHSSLLKDDINAIFEIMSLWDVPMNVFIFHYKTLKYASVLCDAFRHDLLDVLIQKSRDLVGNINGESTDLVTIAYGFGFDVMMLHYDIRGSMLSLQPWPEVPSSVEVSVLNYTCDSLQFFDNEMNKEERTSKGIDVIVGMGYDRARVISQLNQARTVRRMDQYQEKPSSSYFPNFSEEISLKAITSMLIIVVGMLLTKWVASPRANRGRSQKIQRISAKKKKAGK